MRPLLVPARRPTRTVEAIADQVVATGGGLSSYGRDPIDGDYGYKRAGGAGRREVPYWTRERARDYSVTAYRSNPMATAIIDTYTAFCVGDSGVSWQATNAEVGEIVREFWDDPANRVGEIQEIELRSQLLLGEKLQELLVAEHSGVVRFAPIDPAHIKDITCRLGNPLWPDQVILPPGPESEEDRKWALARVDDDTGLRDGRAMFWAPWRTLDTDVRGMPFLTSVLDWLDSYDTVLSNLIDRTALARYMVWDVTVAGGQDKVDEFVAARGGLHHPPSGSVEVHNDAVTWKPQTVSTGAMEDTAANGSVLTNIASGTGLAKTWLSEPDGANRATSLTMAEPVRRRVGSIQKTWLAQQTERVRFVVDRAVAAGRLPAKVAAKDPRTGETTQIPASQAVIVTGPEIAASDSQLTAQVLLNLSTGLEKLVTIGALSKEAAATAARKGWEDYVGVPYTAELDTPDASPDDVAEVVESATRTKERHRAGPRDYIRDGDGKFAETPGSGRRRAPDVSPTPALAQPSASAAPAPVKRSTGAVITDIVEVYGNRHGQWVRIAEIAKARGLTRDDLTPAITELMDDPDFRAEAEPFGARVTDEDRKYAPVIGGEARHLIMWAADGLVESATRTRERHRAGGPRDYVRDGDGQFAHTAGGDLPSAVAAPAPAVSPGADPLKLAGRIQLGPGETFGGSARVHDQAGDQTVVIARVDGPTGPMLRIGVVHPDDTKAWRAGDKGRTIQLDQAGAAEFRAVLRGAQADGKQNVSDFRAELRQAHKEDRLPGLWPSPEADITSGVVRGAAWGDVNWKLTREEGDDYAPGGTDLGPGGKWSLAIDPVTPGGDGRQEPFYVESAAAISKLDKAIANLIGER